MAQPVSASKSEKQWEAESDARTLAEAQVIATDKKRMKAAAKAAADMADQKVKEAQAMKQVARKAPKKGG